MRTPPFDPERFASLYDFGEPIPAQLYPVQLVSDLPYPGLPIPGLINMDTFHYYAPQAMLDSGLRLEEKINELKWQNSNCVKFEIHHAKTISEKELVHYVKLMHDSKRYQGEPCTKRDYMDFEAFIRLLPEFQKSPP